MNRRSLFATYALGLSAPILAVSLSLLVEALFSYRSVLANASSVQAVEGRNVAERLGQYLELLRMQVRDVSEVNWEAGNYGDKERLIDFQRLMKRVPAIVTMSISGGLGSESIQVSRTNRDRIWINRDPNLSPANGAVQPREEFGSFELRGGVDPIASFTTRLVRHADDTLQTEVNLKSLMELVRQIRFAETGHAFLIDRAGLVIAHPDLRNVIYRSKIDIAGGGSLPLSGTNPSAMIEAKSFDGSRVFRTITSVRGTQWFAVVEQDASEIDGALVSSVRNSLLIGGVGLLLAILTAYRIAEQFARPIVLLSHAATKFGNGDLAARVVVREDSAEIGDLSSEFNKMADQLQSYTTSLEQKVSEKTAQLELANRHKSEFLANMSHELRTPLNAVIGFSDVLKEQYFGELNPKQQQYVKDINESGQHLLSLINDILDLSKIEAGKMDLELSRFHLPTSLDNALVLVRERATRRQLQLKASIAEGIGDIVADERKVKQILINLLTNAVKFSHPGGWVEVIVARGTNETMMTVKDMGPGIARADQAAIFEEFHQLNTGGSAKQEGTGLGLSLARRFTELHGGRIWVESEPGAGAAFTFTLPDRELPADGGAHSGAVA